MGKLNPLKVKNEKPQLKEVRRADGNGLFLRIRPSGAKSWLYCFRLPNSRALQQMTIGSINEYSLNEAREIRSELRKQVKQGLDPRQVRAAKKAKNTDALTMQALFESWIKFQIDRKSITTKWLKAHEGRWKNHIQNSLGNILARDITHAHLAKVLDDMACKGIREETRKALTMLNLILDYGLKRHFVEQNSARVLKPKDFAVSANRPRDRALSLSELRKLWSALDWAIQKRDGIAKTSLMNIITATAIKILILTGARRGEVAAMRWDELNFDDDTWIIPSQKTKNRQTHIIFLSPLAKELLRSLMSLTGHLPFVFDTGLNIDGHIHIDALTRSLRRLRVKDEISKETADIIDIADNQNPKKKKKKIKTEPPLKDMKPFTVHDLRRSGATAWGEHLKIQPHVIERMLNHQPLNKLIRTYQHATYLEEQKAAWLAWGKLIENQIAKDLKNVIPIQTRLTTKTSTS